MTVVARVVRRLPVVVLSLALLVTSCGAGLGTGELQGQVVEPAQPKPSFTLTDTDGRPFDFATETVGKLTLLYFGYLGCPDICPVHLAQIAEVFDQHPGLAGETEVVFVSVDPGRDHPDDIRRYLDGFDSRFIGLTGTDAELVAAQEAAGVPPASKVGEDEDYTVDHAGWVIAYAPDDMNHSLYPFGTRQSEWSNDLPILAAMGPER